jgi:hypothetical protein
MVPADTSVRLFLALILAVYGYLIGLERPAWNLRAVAAVVGIVPFLVWLAAPGVVEAGDIGMGVTVRRASLVVGAFAVGFRYASVRVTDRPARVMTTFAVTSAGLLFVAVGIGSSNWLVAAAFAISAFAAGGISSSEASGDAARKPRQHRPDG